MMGKNTSINLRIDEETKSEAHSVFSQLGLSFSQAVMLYLKQVILHKGIPFELNIPNELTTETLEKSEAGQDLHTVSSVDELFKELDS